MSSNLRSHGDFPLRIWQLLFYTLICITGIFGNSLILEVLKRNKNMRKSAFGIYIGSLAVADLIVTILCIPVYVTSTSWFKSHPTGIAGDVMCKLVTGYFILFFFAVVSVYTLVALSFERYYLICHPFKSLTHSTPERAKFVVSFIWIFAAVPNLSLIIGQRSADPKQSSIGAHCTYYLSYEHNYYGRIAFAVVFIVQYLLPISCMVFCFLNIKREMRTKSHSLFGSSTAVQPGELVVLRARRKTVRTVIIMIVSYFSCWSLNQVLYFFLNFGIGMPWNGNLMQFSVMLCFLSSCVNPFIYAYRSRNFRQGFIDILCSCKRKASYEVRPAGLAV